MHKNFIIGNILSDADRETLLFMSEKYKQELAALPKIPDEEDGADYFVDMPTIKVSKKDMGRLVLHRFKVPEEIVQKFINALNDSGVEGYTYLNSTIYLEYSSLHGIPKLTPHKDPEKNILFFDYQLYSTTDWPIVVDDNEYKLVDNSGVMFIGNEQYHGRPFKVFKDNEEVRMLILRFKKLV